MSFDRHRYKEIRVLGTGGFSTVYLVEDQYTGQKIALKVIKSIKLNRKNIIRLQDEFLLLHSLKHQNLVRVYDIGFQPDSQSVYYTMEYCRRTNLMSFLMEATERRMVDAMVQVLRALNFIHSHDIIHFDIKPENFGIIEERGKFVIKLLDFGLFMPKSQIKTSSVRGTLQYMAPELFSKAPRDHRLDLYSLGVVYLKILLARNHVEQKTKYVDFEKLTTEQLESIKEQSLLAIVSRLVKRNPDDRYRNAYHVLEDIRTLYRRGDELVPKEDAARMFFEPRFVGRNNELNYLKVLFVSSNIQTFQTSFVLIRGESGIGKTRLMQELRIYAQLTGYKVREAWCTTTGDNFGVARQLFSQLMPSYDESVGERYGEDFARVFQALVCDKTADITKLPVEQGMDETVVSGYVYQLVNLFEDLIEDDPVREPVFYVHDIHLMDEMSLQFLKPFVQKTSRVLWFISVSSDVDLPRYVEKFIEELEEADHVETVFLRALSRQDVVELLRTTFPNGVLTTAFEDFIFEQSGGNPMLISELLKSMISIGDLRVVNGVWKAATEPSENLALISLLENVLQFRVLALSPVERDVMTSLALIQEPTSFRFLRKLYSHEAEIESVVAGLVENRMLNEFNSRYVVAHGGLRQTILRFMDPERLPDIHLKLAETNSELQEFRFEDTARFYVLANKRDKGLEFYDRAYRSYRNLFRNEKVLEIAETLYQLTNSMEDKRDYLEEAIRTCLYAGDTRKAETYIATYRDQYVSTFEQEVRYNYFQVDWFNRQGKVKAAREWLLDFYLENRDALEAGPYLGRLYLSLGQLFVKEGDMDGAELYLNLASGFIHEEGADDVMLGNLNQLMATTMIVRGNLDAAREHLDAVNRTYSKAAFLPGLSAMHNNLGKVAMKEGDWVGARKAFETAVQIQNKVGNYFQLVLSFGYMSRSWRKQGRYGEAWQSLERGIKYLDLIRDSWGKIFFHTEKSAFLIEMGELIEAENTLMLAEILASESEFKREQVHIDLQNARIMLFKGQLQQGYHLAKSTEEGYRTVGGVDDQLSARLLRVSFLVKGKKWDRSRELLDEAVPLFKKVRDPSLQSAFHRTMGIVLCNAEGNGENSVYQLNEAVRISSESGLILEELLSSAALIRAIPAGAHQGMVSNRKRAIPDLMNELSEVVPKRYWRQFQLREDIYGIVKNYGRS